MRAVWSDEAVYALIALELKLAERYSAEKAAEVVDALVRRVDYLQEHRSSEERDEPTGATSTATGNRRSVRDRFQGVRVAVTPYSKPHIWIDGDGNA